MNTTAFLFLLLALTCTPFTESFSQHILWQDQYHPSDGFAFAKALSAAENYLVVAGTDSTMGMANGLVRAYHQETGKLLWEVRTGKPKKTGGALATIVNDLQVFIGGAVVNADGNGDFFVKACDIRDGRSEWEDLYDCAGRNDEVSVQTMAVADGRVFAGGIARKKTGGADWIVRAYNAENGSLLWQDLYDGGSFDHPVSIDANGTYVVASGVTTDVDTIRHFTIRVYDAKSGSLLWQDSPGGRKGFFFVTDVAWKVTLRDDIVLAAGSIGDSAGIRFIARAYDARSGKLHWGDVVNKGGVSDVAFSLAYVKNRVIIAGSGGVRCDPMSASNCDILIRAYGIEHGELLWERVLDWYGTDDRPIKIVANGDRVAVIGEANDTTGKIHWTVQVFKADDGATLWEDAVTEEGGDARPVDVQINENRLFVAGLTYGSGGKETWLVRVYSINK